MKARIIFAIAAALLATSCGTKLFDQETVEKSRSGAMVTVIFNAGGLEGVEAVWESDGKTSRTVTGVIGTPLAVETPVLSGHLFVGWAAEGGDAKLVTAFPEENSEYTAVWEKDVVVVRLNKKRLGIIPGKSETLVPTCLPLFNVLPHLEWTSSDESVATVDKNGKVTVLDNAELGQKSVITVKTRSEKTAECEVIVTETLDRAGEYTVLSSYESPTGVENDGTNYVSFGTFPQSLKSSDVEIYGEEWDSRKGAYCTMKQGGMTYYLGTDNCWYARVSAEPNGFENFNDDTTPILNSERYYFKVEPLKWRIVSTEYKDGNGNANNTLLFSEYGIVTGIPYYGAPTRTLSGETIYPNNYKYSNIRAYLNGTKNQFESDGGTITASDVDWTGKGFIDIAFTASQKAKIKRTTVDNSPKSTGFGNNAYYSVTNRILEATSYKKGSFVADDIPAYACDNTEDKIFLLSQTEVSNVDNKGENYLGFGVFWARYKKLQRITTDYARALGGAQSGSASCSRWCLRSPKVLQTTDKKLRADSSAVASVHGEGKAMEADTYNVATNTIVPALCVE